MVVAGVATVIFNGNPLLRYDGYFILSDLLGIPNLANRANRYWGYVMRRFVFGGKNPAPATARGEAKWLLIYAPAAYFCRIVVMTTIVLMIAGRFFSVGVAIAIWTVTVRIAGLMVRGLGEVMTTQALAPNRLRVIAIITAGFAILALLVGVVPMPLHTVAEGVVWLPEESIVRAEADGFLRKIAAEPGRMVGPGQLLMVSTDPDLDAEIKADLARVAALKAQYFAQIDDKVQAAMTRRKLEVEQSVLARADERAVGLMSYSGAAGRFVVPGVEDLLGRYHKRGDVLGFVLPKTLDMPPRRGCYERGRLHPISCPARRARSRAVARKRRIYGIRTIPGRCLATFNSTLRFIPKQPLALLVPTFGFASIMVPSRSPGKLGAGYGNFFYRASMSDRKPWRLRDRALGPYMEHRRPTPHAADRLLSVMTAPLIARFTAGSLGSPPLSPP